MSTKTVEERLDAIEAKLERLRYDARIHAGITNIPEWERPSLAQFAADVAKSLEEDDA
jgi:hypothetical protein